MQLAKYENQLSTDERKLLAHERILAQRAEKVFKKVGLKRVGTITVSDHEPDNPEWKADSTVWVKESTRRAYRWRSGRWVSQSQADTAVRSWIRSRGTRDRGKDEADRSKYRREAYEE